VIEEFTVNWKTKIAATIDEHKTTMEIEVRKTMNYEDYESTMCSWIFVGTVGL
jgi:hypothetical protein